MEGKRTIRLRHRPKADKGMAFTRFKPEGKQSHPSYNEMIKNALLGLKQARGSSSKDILEYICSEYSIKNDGYAKRNLNVALRNGVKKCYFHKISKRGRSETYQLEEQSKVSRLKFTKCNTDTKKKGTHTGKQKKVKPEKYMRGKQTKPTSVGIEITNKNQETGRVIKNIRKSHASTGEIDNIAEFPMKDDIRK